MLIHLRCQRGGHIFGLSVSLHPKDCIAVRVRVSKFVHLVNPQVKTKIGTLDL